MFDYLADLNLHLLLLKSSMTVPLLYPELTGISFELALKELLD